MLAAIPSQLIKPRTYFLIELQAPEIIWFIRIIGIVILIIVLWIFIRMRKKDRDGES